MDISVVVPAFNEGGNVLPLYEALCDVLKGIRYEIIFVDDGSTDETYHKLRSIKDKQVRIICHKQNRGQSFALKSGFENARYGFVLTLDADLQNDPADIPHLIEKINEGYDCVCGYRLKGGYGFVKAVSSKIANTVKQIVLRDGLKDISCPLRLFKKECLDGVELFDGSHRFLSYLIQLNGYKVFQIPVNHQVRKAGKSKYGVSNRIFKVLADLLYVKRLARKIK